jgi:membrane protein implicated in regulation of membrane protease activity
MTANIAFALGAAVVSLAIVVGAGLKGDWTVVAVYSLLVAGFLARASFGRRARREGQEPVGPTERGPPAPARPEHEPERSLGRARFKRR